MSTFDFHFGYHHVLLREEHKEENAFRVLALYMNVKGCPWIVEYPITFSRLKDKAFGKYNAENLFELFLDDILVHTATFDQLIQRMKMSLIQLARYGLELQPAKCYFSGRSFPFRPLSVTQRNWIR